MNDQNIAQEKYNKLVDTEKREQIERKLQKAQERGKTDKVAKLQNKKEALDRELSQTQNRLDLLTKKGENLVSVNKMKGYQVIAQPGYKRYVAAGRDTVKHIAMLHAGVQIGGAAGAFLILASEPEDVYVKGTKYKLK